MSLFPQEEFWWVSMCTCRGEVIICFGCSMAKCTSPKHEIPIWETTTRGATHLKSLWWTSNTHQKDRLYFLVDWSCIQAPSIKTMMQKKNVYGVLEDTMQKYHLYYYSVTYFVLDWQITLTKMSEGKGNTKITLVFQENRWLLYYVATQQFSENTTEITWNIVWNITLLLWKILETYLKHSKILGI